MWNQYGISLSENILVGPLKFRTTRRNKLKQPNIIEENQYNSLEKEWQKKVISKLNGREVLSLGQY